METKNLVTSKYHSTFDHDPFQVANVFIEDFCTIEKFRNMYDIIFYFKTVRRSNLPTF